MIKSTGISWHDRPPIIKVTKLIDYNARHPACIHNVETRHEHIYFELAKQKLRGTTEPNIDLTCVEHATIEVMVGQSINDQLLHVRDIFMLTVKI